MNCPGSSFYMGQLLSKPKESRLVTEGTLGKAPNPKMINSSQCVCMFTVCFVHIFYTQSQITEHLLFLQILGL